MSHYKSESILVLLPGQALCHLQCGKNRRGSGIIFSYEPANGKWYKFQYAKVMFCIFCSTNYMFTCLYTYSIQVVCTHLRHTSK